MENKLDRNLLSNLKRLSPEAMRLVEEVVAVLVAKQAAPAKRNGVRARLSKEPFVGMWADRADMADGPAYIRKLRNTEWARK